MMLGFEGHSMIVRMISASVAVGLIITYAASAAAQADSTLAMESAPQTIPESPIATQHTTMIFFDFDTSELTDDAREMISMAVLEAGNTGVTSVHVTGHSSNAHAEPGTDESYQYNLELSQSRAEAVRDEMVRLGMNEDIISVVAVGVDEPLVPTGPGVMEPLNRRAIIELMEP
jgi:OOP family OmpA-OmpF porin